MQRTPSSLVRVGATLLGVAGLWYLVCETVAAIGFPGYSYAHHWISDLGVPEPGVFQGRTIDSRLAVVMNAGFLGQGLLFALVGVLVFWGASRGQRRALFLTLTLAHGFGMALVGLVHGSQANQDAGLGVFHVGGALAAILSANLAVITAGSHTLRGHLGARVGRACVWLGSLGIASLAILALGTVTGSTIVFDAPVWERGSVYTISAAELLIAGTVIARRRREEGSPRVGGRAPSEAPKGGDGRVDEPTASAGP